METKQIISYSTFPFVCVCVLHVQAMPDYIIAFQMLFHVLHLSVEAQKSKTSFSG